MGRSARVLREALLEPSSGQRSRKLGRDVWRSAGTGAGAGGPVDIVGSLAESSRASADDPAVSTSRLMVITLITGSDTNEGTTTALCDTQSLDTDWPIIG